MRRNLSSALALFVLASPAFAATLTPAQIERDIRVHGARVTVQSLDREGKFNAVLDRIASGKAAWVRLAPGLAQGTDAGDSTGLTVALARALPKNPTAVLAALDEGPVIGPAAVCGVPFIEPSPQEVHEYLGRAIPAVTHVEPSDRLAHRSACLEALHHAQDQTSR
ncbi:hypothetical protein FAZ95_36190 [Trinickia violacea]|uniref:Uncharacterized protein n=1 Tax=Trinickia violacea TaxID=2571746 RepID=A0A4P8IYG7_9BURK|nr:hypothetical protein [Trinickia violacea]QCP54382.1 hypothetical protein FAZ95_36190 [Trinickia violacea]